MKNQQSIKPPVYTGRSQKNSEDQIETNHKKPQPVEVGGPKGPEPTRYGDWEQAGRCTDF